jgi:hypothetical protein
MAIDFYWIETRIRLKKSIWRMGLIDTNRVSSKPVKHINKHKDV